MAASGSITINLESIDYTGRLPSGTCYTDGNKDSFGRGTGKAVTTVNWYVNNNNVISFSDGGTEITNRWRVCSANGYNLEIQYSTNQVNWTTIASSSANKWPCGESPLPETHGVEKIATELIGKLQPFQLTQSGYIRIYTWTERACPTSNLPNAYPNQTGSQAVAVPIYIELDYRPGEVRINGEWKSCNRDGGRCDKRENGAWVEMKTIEGSGDPPSVRESGAWRNQSKIGSA